MMNYFTIRIVSRYKGDDTSVLTATRYSRVISHNYRSTLHTWFENVLVFKDVIKSVIR